MPVCNEVLELTHELRLRRWARQNYVPAGDRLDSWHAVILGEMQQKDRELAEVAIPATLRLKSETAPVVAVGRRGLRRSA